MDQRTITMIWIGGGVLALLVYLAGPDMFLSGIWGFLDRIEAGFHALLAFLGAQAFDVVRAAAIAIYIVFLVLGGIAIHRGVKSIAAMIAVTLGFVILVWRPDQGAYISSTRWLAALALAIIGALVLTQRLTAPARRLP